MTAKVKPVRLPPSRLAKRQHLVGSSESGNSSSTGNKAADTGTAAVTGNGYAIAEVQLMAVVIRVWRVGRVLRILTIADTTADAISFARRQY